MMVTMATLLPLRNDPLNKAGFGMSKYIMAGFDT
jgi:hypothetical protein